MPLAFFPDERNRLKLYTRGQIRRQCWQFISYDLDHSRLHSFFFSSFLSILQVRDELCARNLLNVLSLYTRYTSVSRSFFRFYNSRITCDSPREKIFLIRYVFSDSLVEFIYLGEFFNANFLNVRLETNCTTQ